MTTHNYHPHTWRNGGDGPVLADECPRCEEHTQNPHLTLDNGMIARLKEIHDNEGPYYSSNDRKACERLFGVYRG